MSTTLPRLRIGLDIMPSPIPDKPGLLIRDPFRYAEEIIIVPPLLAAGLILFDGESTILDVQAYLTRLSGQLIPSSIIQSFYEALQKHGFLESPAFEELQKKRHEEFASSRFREPAHIVTGYEEESDKLRVQLGGYLNGNMSEPEKRIIGLAAPHVSPWGGGQSYAAAYGRLTGKGRSQAAGKTIVVLGTSHYGRPDKFGLTRKPFITPLGEIEPDIELIDWINERAGDSVLMEDYCHAIEHSIEFQCIFLQQILGTDFKLLPILCGPFSRTITDGDEPEKDDGVYRFFNTLGELADNFSPKLFWVLGVDLAHMGPRYGDQYIAQKGDEEMLEVELQDRRRLKSVCNGNSMELFELVREGQDRLKWCGFPPIYTFMNALPESRAEILHYDQWNIDEQSIVSFAALEFTLNGG